ncbi:lysophosphatidylcholine acyltransferase [Anaeramoeba flamelloides]|uniref:Lysophosphatidylcholine acyltransferase n=1 Tax=Anaeramoeba flamelloides TaxID=1746091 RepID=A0AAV7ZCE6_9EUKA|nr:lysophosphatidylcholine acyltransferase [Anaeramoeba flamelloides]
MNITTDKNLHTIESKKVNDTDSEQNVEPWVATKMTKMQIFWMIFTFVFTLGPIRVLLFILIHAISLIFYRIMAIGVNESNSYGKFRSKLIEKWTNIGSRLSIATMGYYRIKIVNKENYVNWKKNRNERIIISNHSNQQDIEIILSLIATGFIAKSSVKNIPFIGSINTCLQGIYVDRSKKNTWIFDKIKLRATNKKLLPIAIFPEGTCTNNKSLLKFKVGAFSAGAPIQPLLIKYKAGFPLSFINLYFTVQNPWIIFLNLFTNIINHVEVTFMDPVQPTEEEKINPKLYLENVQKKYQEVSNWKVHNLGYRDMVKYMEEMKKVKKNN